MEKDLNSLILSLAQKEAEIENLQRLLLKEQVDHYSKFSIYMGQLKNLKVLLRVIERRTSGSLNQQIKEVLEQLDNYLKYENILDEFVMNIENQFPNLSANLSKNLDFTAKQKIICYSIKVGMSLKQTANLMGTSIYAIKQARGRIWKKSKFSSYDEFKSYVLSL